MGNRNVLVIAPHPDDETLGVGGTILKHKEKGDNVAWLMFTNICDSSNHSDSFKESRREEIKKINKFYGFKEYFELPFSATKLDVYPMVEMISKVSDVLNKVQPDTLYVPFVGDVHSDHKVVFDVSMSCSKIFRHPYIKKILAYETLSETNFSSGLSSETFCPNLYVDISNYLDQKLSAMKIYGSEISEHPFPRSLEALKALAVLRGSVANVRYAEAFNVIREVY